MLWVLDFIYVVIWKGFVYVVFVIDVYVCKIVGWCVSSFVYVGFVFDVLE